MGLAEISFTTITGRKAWRTRSILRWLGLGGGVEEDRIGVDFGGVAQQLVVRVFAADDGYLAAGTFEDISCRTGQRGPDPLRTDRDQVDLRGHACRELEARWDVCRGCTGTTTRFIDLRLRVP